MTSVRPASFSARNRMFPSSVVESCLTVMDTSCGDGGPGLGRYGLVAHGELRELRRLVLELLVVQPRIEAALRDELAVRPALRDPALLEHEDPVGAQDRGQPGRDPGLPPA